MATISPLDQMIVTALALKGSIREVEAMQEALDAPQRRFFMNKAAAFGDVSTCQYFAVRWGFAGGGPSSTTMRSLLLTAARCDQAAVARMVLQLVDGQQPPIVQTSQITDRKEQTQQGHGDQEHLSIPPHPLLLEALAVAAQTGHVRVLDGLLRIATSSCGARPSRILETKAEQAHQNRARLVALLSSPNRQGSTLGAIAAANNRTSVLRWLEANGVDVLSAPSSCVFGVGGWTLVHIAAMHGHKDVLAWLQRKTQRNGSGSAQQRTMAWIDLVSMKNDAGHTALCLARASPTTAAVAAWIEAHISR